MVSCQPAAPGTRRVPRRSFVPVPGEQRRGPTAAPALRRHVPGAGVVPVASGGERPAGAALASRRVRPGVGGDGERRPTSAAWYKPIRFPLGAKAEPVVKLVPPVPPPRTLLFPARLRAVPGVGGRLGVRPPPCHPKFLAAGDGSVPPRLRWPRQGWGCRHPWLRATLAVTPWLLPGGDICGTPPLVPPRFPQLLRGVLPRSVSQAVTGWGRSLPAQAAPDVL